MKSQRKFANLFKNPHFNAKYSRHLLLGGVTFFGVMLIFVVNTINNLNDTVAEIPAVSVEVAYSINSNLLLLGALLIITYMGFVCLSYIYALIFTHRISGPIVAICAVIEQLKAGEYVIDRELRKNDELQPIMDGLQQLASMMQKNSITEKKAD